MQIKCTYNSKKYKKICVSQQILVSLRQIRTNLYHETRTQNNCFNSGDRAGIRYC